MADDKSKKDARDRNRVAAVETYELAYLEEKMAGSREQVMEAIKAVGNDRSKVEAYLKDGR